MRKFTLSVAAFMLAVSAFATNIVVDHQEADQKVYLTFPDYSVVIPGVFMGNYTCTASINGDDATWYIYPMLNEAEDFTNVIYFDYMLYMPALMNGGILPDGEYTLTFNEGFLTYEYGASQNDEPVEVSFTVGNTTGISNIENNVAAQSYNLQGQQVNGVKGFSVINGKKVFVK